MNPYGRWLGERDPFQVVAASEDRLRDLLGSFAPRDITRAPGPNRWSVREILCHLADTEVVFAYRLRQALAEPHHVIQAYDQDRWAVLYSAFDAHIAMETFAAVRRWNLALLAKLPPGALAKRVTHPERGEMTFQVLVETMAGHDLQHISRIQEMADALPERDRQEADSSSR